MRSTQKNTSLQNIFGKGDTDSQQGNSFICEVCNKGLSQKHDLTGIF